MSEYTANDICQIMRQAAKLGVTSFSTNDLDINFSKNGEVQARTPSISQNVDDRKSEDVNANVGVIEQQQMQKVISEQAQKLEHYRKTEEKYANLPIEDPLQWEETEANMAPMSGEIEDAENLHVQ